MQCSLNNLYLIYLFLSNSSNKGFAYCEIDAVNINISYIKDNSYKNLSTKGLFKTYNVLFCPSIYIFNIISLFLEKGVKAEWTKVSSKSNINVFLTFSLGLLIFVLKLEKEELYLKKEIFSFLFSLKELFIDGAISRLIYFLT